MSSTTTTNFIRTMITADLAAGKHADGIVTRFPPEPNGYLHIGHAKAIVLNFGIAAAYGGKCKLRFDDTNPAKESAEYIEAIRRDITWLGYQPSALHFASAYFEQLYHYAEQLIKHGKAYVDDQTADEIRQTRGTLTEPGQPSRYRQRSAEENLRLFRAMRDGEYKDGEKVLRARIDMASPNLNLRDPVLYRIKHAAHHQTAKQWCIYPMYDYAHCLSDAMEGITHSLCTLEFEDHRPLYDWILDALPTPCHPQQIEFARLQLEHTLTSKRGLRMLIEQGAVTGWDDPRMPTLSGMRRRGIPPNAIRNFCELIGVAKSNSVIELLTLENCTRDALNATAPRRLAVLNPLKVVIENYPAEQTEMLTAQNHPQQPEQGIRQIPFSRELYIERDDFMTDPPKKFFRLSPGREVRLRFAYYIRCTEVIKDADGQVIALHCTYDPQTRGGKSADGRKVKGTIHWVSAAHAVKAQVHLYDRLFLSANPTTEHLMDDLNPRSLVTLDDCMLEPSLAKPANTAYQFERNGYFCADSSATAAQLVFNRIVSLRDSWGKIKPMK